MGKIKKRLIVQPHSDDSLFSCSHVLFMPEYEVQVLTVESDERRIQEDTKLFDFLKIPYHHLNVSFKDESYYGYNKLYSKDGITEEHVVDYLNEYFGEDKINEIQQALKKWIKKFIKNNPDYTVIAPWGIGHPFHFFIRNVLQGMLNDLEYYREFPHSYKKRSQKQVEEQKQEYDLIRSVPVADFHEIKWKLAKTFYKSQSGLLFYEQGYIKKELPEEIYKKN